MSVKKGIFMYVCLLAIIVNTMAAPSVYLLQDNTIQSPQLTSISEAVDHDGLFDIIRIPGDNIQIVTENFNPSPDFFIISHLKALHSFLQRLNHILLSVQTSIELQFTISDIIFPFSYFW